MPMSRDIRDWIGDLEMKPALEPWTFWVTDNDVDAADRTECGCAAARANSREYACETWVSLTRTYVKYPTTQSYRGWVTYGRNSARLTQAIIANDRLGTRFEPGFYTVNAIQKRDGSRKKIGHTKRAKPHRTSGVRYMTTGVNPSR